MAIQVYGIPNCGTCKKALKWLDDNSISYEFIDTKEAPPNKTMIQGWVEAIGSKSMRNTSGQSYRAIDKAERETWTDEQWVEAFAADAMLLKRPLFVKDGAAVLAGFRASEEVLRETLGS